MNNKNHTEGHKPVPTASAVLPTGELVELVYDPRRRRTALAVGSATTASVGSSVDAGDTKLVPWNARNNLIRHETMVLPERSEEFGSVADLLAEIEEYLAKYVDLAEEKRRVTAGYILLSWVYDAFNELPYLRFRGDLGSGKTRALIVAGSLCYRGFFASGASTVSPIFHTLDTFRGTLILDEADFRFSDEKAELSKILNNGNVRGFPVLRTMITREKEFDPRAFFVYGPKIVAMRGYFDDPALESRFITIDMEVGETAPNVPINLPDEQKEEARALRNKLLMYRFKKRLGVSVDPTLYDPTLTPRANQITLPLLSLLDDASLRDVTRSIVRETHADTLAERAASPAGQLIALLLEIAATSSRSAIPLSEVAAAFAKRYVREYDRPITTRYIGLMLRRVLEIRPYKTTGIYHVGLSRAYLARRAAQFGVEVNPAPAHGERRAVRDSFSGTEEAKSEV